MTFRIEPADLARLEREMGLAEFLAETDSGGGGTAIGAVTAVHHERSH